MVFNKRKRIRNANYARDSFVTRRAELKINALADLFKLAAGKSYIQMETGLLQRELTFSGFHYLNFLRLIYNWENRFMSVNYNLQITSDFSTDSDLFEETGDCNFFLKCNQGLFSNKRNYLWKCAHWEGSETRLNLYIERLSNPLIFERLKMLDIMEMEIQYKADWGYWRMSCESIIGSATWILIPPVFSMITPKLEECIKFLELYELIGDALINNKEGIIK